ncbi:MAG: DUF523 domain-containing protein [Polyangiaceae bacterium]|nr:DUF523 domain-containing protein [Polyangiaceae bacterium]
MRLPHDPTALARFRAPSAEEPLRLLVSGCLAGRPCGVNGSDYGLGARLAGLLALPTVSVAAFCPEDHALGTPRTMPDIHGGDGHDVLDGRARVLDEHGVDLTDQMIAGARAMLDAARTHRAELALLTDMSAACGSQVISAGCRLVAERRFTAGVGVATALLLRDGIPVLSQRDENTLSRLRELLEPSHRHDPALLDYHETPWYLEAFPTPVE